MIWFFHPLSKQLSQYHLKKNKNKNRYLHNQLSLLPLAMSNHSKIIKGYRFICVYFCKINAVLWLCVFLIDKWRCVVSHPVSFCTHHFKICLSMWMSNFKPVWSAAARFAPLVHWWHPGFCQLPPAYPSKTAMNSFQFPPERPVWLWPSVRLVQGRGKSPQGKGQFKEGTGMS